MAWQSGKQLSIIMFHLKPSEEGITSLECNSGPPTVLTVEEEEKLAHYCVQMADMGFGLSREDVMITAFNIVDHSGKAHPFTHGQAGRSWFDGFRERHPHLTYRSAQALSRAHAACGNEAFMTSS